MSKGVKIVERAGCRASQPIASGHEKRKPFDVNDFLPL